MSLGPLTIPGSARRSQEFGPARTSASGWWLQPAMYGISNLAAYWQPYKNWPLYDHFHNGVDETAPIGTPLLAPENAKVIHVGIRLVPATGQPDGGGNVLGLEVRPGTVIYLAHCSEILVRVGQIVRKGQIVARLGATGLVTGPVVHATLEVAEVSAGVKRTILWNLAMHQAGGPYAGHARIRPAYGLPAPQPSIVAWSALMRSIGYANIRATPGGPIVQINGRNQATYPGQLFLSYRIRKDGAVYVDPRNGNRRRDWVEVRYGGVKRWVAKAFLVTERKL